MKNWTGIRTTCLLLAAASSFVPASAQRPTPGVQSVGGKVPIVNEDARLSAGDAAIEDWLGVSVAVSGDTALVGAWGDDHTDMTDAGSVYVFSREGGVWSERAKMTTGQPQPGDHFGVSVAISGDTAVVGNLREQFEGPGDIGATHVFVREGDTWSEQDKLIAADALPGDGFGFPVAISGDTAVVGAHLADHTGSSFAGTAYVFVRRDGTWFEQAKLTASDAAAGDHFGLALAISGDTVVIGAFRADHASEYGAGAAYVFVRRDDTWFEQAKLIASDARAGDELGRSVAVSGDTAVVGAWQDDVGGVTGAGSAYVLTRHHGAWSEQAKLTASDARTFDQAGWSVAISEDENAAVVGAWRGDDEQGVMDAGAAHVFVRCGDSWFERAKLTISDAAYGDRLGWSAALSHGAAIVGASGVDLDGDTDAGSAYVFDLRRLAGGSGYLCPVDDERGPSGSVSPTRR